MKKIIISGGSGLVGSAIVSHFPESVEEFVILTRSADLDGKRDGRQLYSAWNPADGSYRKDHLKGADAIINLAGASVAQRWTSAHKKAILESRIKSTDLLVRIAREHSEITTFVSASAIGFYAPSDQVLSEDAPPDTGFLSEVVTRWEGALEPLRETAVRTVALRIGMVLARDGGFYRKMAPVFRLGLGARLGNGRQLMSWIHIEDLVRMFHYALNETRMQGPYNAVGPEVLDNKSFTRIMADSFGKKVWAPPVPAFALKLFLGEMASVALDSVGADAGKILDAGFEFRYPSLDAALKDLASKA